MRKKKDILRIMMFIYSTLFYLCRKQRYENNMNPLFDKPFTLRNALLPFLIAWLLAYMMQPFVKFFQYKLCFKSRILSIMAVLVTLGLLITLLIVMVVPSIAAEADKTLELIRTHDPGEGHVPLIPPFGL